MKRLDMYCDASPSAEGVGLAWAGWVEADVAPSVKGTAFLSGEVEPRHAECLAVIEGSWALLTSIEAGHERQDELVVLHSDNIPVAKSLGTEIVHPPLELWIP